MNALASLRRIQDSSYSASAASPRAPLFRRAASRRPSSSARIARAPSRSRLERRTSTAAARRPPPAKSPDDTRRSPSPPSGPDSHVRALLYCTTVHNNTLAQLNHVTFICARPLYTPFFPSASSHAHPLSSRTLRALIHASASSRSRRRRSSVRDETW
jgi:hypothetical protein